MTGSPRPSEKSLTDGSVVPVFPLPDLVFFPDTGIPLHIFEPRYREMIRDASSGAGLVGMALLRPGYENDYDGRPEIYPIGTVGRIEELRSLPDGRYLLNLRGLSRAAYHEIASEKSYRVARASLRPELPGDATASERGREKLDLLTTHALLSRALAGSSAPALAMNDRIPFAAAVNRACMDLPIAAELRQELLVIDDLLERHGRVARLMDEILQQVLSESAGDARNDLLC